MDGCIKIKFVITTYKNIALIYNPFAGRLQRRPERLQEAVAALQRAGHGVNLFPTKAPGSAGQQAREAIAGGADLILACGGDGTINEVASGVIGTIVPFAILPGGTANVLSMETGQGSNMAKTAAGLSLLVPKRISVGRLQMDGQPDRHFLMMLGAGLDAKVVAAVRPAVKRKLGKVAYWIAGLMQTGKTLEESYVTTPTGEHKASFILVSRIRNYGGDLEIARNVTLLDDDFEVVLFEGTNSLRYLPYFAGVITKQHRRVPGVKILRTAQLDLKPVQGQQMLVQADGELMGAVPARIEIVPAAITLLLPPQYVQRHS